MRGEFAASLAGTTNLIAYPEPGPSVWSSFLSVAMQCGQFHDPTITHASSPARRLAAVKTTSAAGNVLCADHTCTPAIAKIAQTAARSRVGRATRPRAGFPRNSQPQITQMTTAAAIETRGSTSSRPKQPQDAGSTPIALHILQPTTPSPNPATLRSKSDSAGASSSAVPKPTSASATMRTRASLVAPLSIPFKNPTAPYGASAFRTPAESSTTAQPRTNHACELGACPSNAVAPCK